jgi:hypothetical protein
MEARTEAKYTVVVSFLGVVSANTTMEGIPLFSVTVGTIGSKEGERSYKQ